MAVNKMFAIFLVLSLAAAVHGETYFNKPVAPGEPPAFASGSMSAASTCSFSSNARSQLVPSVHKDWTHLAFMDQRHITSCIDT